MNLARMKISLLGFLVLSSAVVIIQGGCQKPEGPQHKVAMTPSDLDKDSPATDKPMMKEVRATEVPADAPADAETPEPVVVNPGSRTGNDPAPLTEIDRSADDVRFYRVKADETYWKIAVKELGNGQRWREIKSLNPGVNPNALKIGQTIRIPVK